MIEQLRWKVDIVRTDNPEGEELRRELTHASQQNSQLQKEIKKNELDMLEM